MGAYTKGPWTWRSDIQAGEWYLSPGVLAIPNSDGTPGGDEIDRANALLIAAAPDLLEALQLIRSIIADAAPTGFNPLEGDWAERLYLSQSVSADAVRKAGGDIRMKWPQE